MSYQDAVYWKKRADMLYYAALDRIVRVVGKDATSIIDVGSGNCPYLDWWSWIPNRVSIDISAPYSSAGTRGIVANITQYSFDETFDMCTCFQVLEHVADAAAFARRLFEIGTIVVISVPYMWPAGKTRGHVHDPVCQEKLLSWTGRAANHELIVTEPFGASKAQRLIAVYHPDGRFRYKSGDQRRLREIGRLAD